MGAAEVEELLSHLANERNVAASTQNQALSALPFDSFGRRLSRPPAWLALVCLLALPALACGLSDFAG